MESIAGQPGRLAEGDMVADTFVLRAMDLPHPLRPRKVQPPTTPALPPPSLPAGGTAALVAHFWSSAAGHSWWG